MLADLDLSREATYFYSHLPEAPGMSFLTDGTTAYFVGTQEDGQTLCAKVEDENLLPWAFWIDRRVGVFSLMITHQGPYHQTTWVSNDGITSLQPRALQYPTKPLTGEYSASVSTAMSSARRLKEGTATTNWRDQEVDAIAVQMTDEGLHQSGTNASAARRIFPRTHALFTHLVGQGIPETSQQPSGGGVSGTELHVPGGWVQEDE